MSGKIAVVQGSFDPITVGHADIVRRTAAWFDRIFVAVAQNAEKAAYVFSCAARTACVRCAKGVRERFGRDMRRICRRFCDRKARRCVCSRYSRQRRSGI